MSEISDMPLQEIPLENGTFELSEKADSLIWEANRRAEEFYAAGLGLRYPKYIPSDPRLVWESISYLKASGYIQGDVFCEWGCGFGIAAGLASLLGMTAYGIEIEEDLVGRATKLMKDLQLPVEILQMDYLPDGFEESEGHGGKDLILPYEMSSRGQGAMMPEYDGLDPQEVSLFYVYPWPDQEQMMMDLFSAVASGDAILLMYLGDGEMAAFEKAESG